MGGKSSKISGSNGTPVSSDFTVDDQPSYTAVGRRKSVFAEAYNPEEDEDDEKTVRFVDE